MYVCDAYKKISKKKQIIGETGAGKSLLVKVMTGIFFS
jgi:ABC-type sugar transport system ATPase subunit